MGGWRVGGGDKTEIYQIVQQNLHFSPQPLPFLVKSEIGDDVQTCY